MLAQIGDPTSLPARRVARFGGKSSIAPIRKRSGGRSCSSGPVSTEPPPDLAHFRKPPPREDARLLQRARLLARGDRHSSRNTSSAALTGQLLAYQLTCRAVLGIDGGCSAIALPPSSPAALPRSAKGRRRHPSRRDRRLAVARAPTLCQLQFGKKEVQTSLELISRLPLCWPYFGSWGSARDRYIRV
jgi:hypothetical protein